MGQAVTILLRLLGYKDENVGGIWPHGYMAVGQTIGLTNGVGTNPSAGLTRGQAARLFLNLLRSDMREGGSYLGTLGTTEANTMLVSANATGPDGKNNAIQTSAGAIYQLASGKTSSGLLNGRKGTLVLSKQGGKVLTFVPDAAGASRVITLSSAKATEILDANGVKYLVESGTKTLYNGEETVWGDVYSWLHTGTSMTLYLDEAGKVEYVFVGGGSTSTAAVVVYEDHSGAGFAELAGGVTNYAIYKNGAPAGLGDLRRYDVAVYDSASNAIRVCDTRVTVYYESCYPNPQEPSTIEALGHTFDVLPTAMESLSKFRPGDQMTLLLTEDGRVAAAVEATSGGAHGNAVGIVRQDGTVQLLCGTAKISVEGASKADSFKGQLVRVSSARKGETILSRLSGGASGDLYVSERKLGGKKLADNVMLFRNGEDVGLSQLTNGRIPSSQILYARTNWAGDVDLIVLGEVSGSTVYYGRAVWERTKIEGEGDAPATYDESLRVEYGDGKKVGPFSTGYDVRTGEYVSVTVNSKNNGFSNLTRLTELSDVPNSAWGSQTSVTVGGRTYSVPSDVPCYDKTAGVWITLAQARGYADSADLYVSDGVVRVIEIR